ncbi:DegQ family serine endoprotease [Benzoatithermus flavus]|uniref:DegQ family serine endoprotease n=1 Tax=Benzoatithermus flavus TaxID=3108223 RepID=A0ABU8XXB8_9PROT
MSARWCARTLLLVGLTLAGMAPEQEAWGQYPMLDPERGVMTMAPLLERTTPAVVNVSVVSRVPMAENPLFADPFFRRFFDLPEQPREREAISAGSGVIVDAPHGYVLTNHHVVQNADRITVTLKDQREFDAQLVGSDPATDIALLRIPARNLSELPFGDSDRLKVGDLVVAIGNPFGLGQTVTSGIISALGRGGITNDKYEDFIQTDAPINPGNSGGALINSKGELIGINTAILAPGGGNVGIGFAVPSNMARAVMDQLLRFGHVRRGRIGVVIQDVTPPLAEAMGLDAQQGALIAQVERGSPADRAGLRPGDVVLSVDGVPVKSSADLRNRIGLAEVGQTVALEVLRDGRRSRLDVKITAARDRRADAGQPPYQLAGVELSDIPPGHPAFNRIGGVLVTGIARGCPAARAGLRRGDIILGIDQQPIRSLSELRNAELPGGGEQVTLSILRGGTELLVVVG